MLQLVSLLWSAYLSCTVIRGDGFRLIFTCLHFGARYQKTAQNYKLITKNS
jgi:hypothetical protein